MMTPENKKQLASQAAIDMAITQRNANANDAVQMAADLALLRAELSEANERIAALEKKKK